MISYLDKLKPLSLATNVSELDFEIVTFAPLCCFLLAAGSSRTVLAGLSEAFECFDAATLLALGNSGSTVDFLVPSFVVLLVFGLLRMLETVAAKIKKCAIRELDS